MIDKDKSHVWICMVGLMATMIHPFLGFCFWVAFVIVVMEDTSAEN